MAILVRQNEQYRLKMDSVARLEADNELARQKAAEAEQTAKDAQEALGQLQERNEMVENNLRTAQERLARIQGKWWYKLFAGKEG